VERDLRPVEHLQQFRLAAEQPTQQPIEHHEAGSSSEDAIETGAQFGPALCGRLLALGFEVGVEPPDQPAHSLLGGVLILGEGVEPVHQAFGVDPAQRVAADIELAGIVAEDGLAVRHDHGSNFGADHFQKRIRFWGLAPSDAFVREPGTNGVVERFFRTLKEQAIDGHVFRTIDEVRDAARTFAARYNAEWLIEKNGYLRPLDARAVWLDTPIRRAA
jgi:hypothetical protein